MNKTKALIKHTHNRAKERLDLNLSKLEIKELSNICKHSKYLYFLEKISNIKSKMIVKYKNKIFPVVYDKSRHCIVTILTMDMLSKDELDDFYWSYNING